MDGYSDIVTNLLILFVFHPFASGAMCVHCAVAVAKIASGDFGHSVFHETMKER
jgi:hypothetical protein